MCDAKHTPEEVAEAVWSTLMDAINDRPSEASTLPAKSSGWRYDIQYGPEGEANYAWVYDDAGAMVGTMRTHQAVAITRTMNAAPSLLEALQALVDDLSHFPAVSESIFHSLNLADAVLAKASGETP